MAKRRRSSRQPKLPPWVVGLIAAIVVVLGGVGVISQSGALDLLSNGLGLDVSPLVSVMNAIDNFLYGGPTKAPPSLPAQGQLKVNVIDVGQGESILVTTAETSVLIDAGENDKGDEVVDYLNQMGLERLDYVIATHPHSDHIGGMDYVLENIPAGQVLFGPVPDQLIPTTKTYSDLLEVIRQRDIPLDIVEPGDQLDLGSGAVLTVLGPVREDYDDLNLLSVVCRVDFGETSFLLNGDTEKEAEQELLASGANLRADVTTMGHHGSRTSSSLPYLERIGARYASISCGKGNKYDHPHQETLEKLDERGTEYYRTDINGSIVFTSNGTRITAESRKP